MTGKIIVKVVILSILLLASVGINSTVAQTPTPERKKVCAEEGMTIYEAWIEDIPCLPDNFPPKYENNDSHFGADANSPQDSWPDVANYIDLVFSSFQDGSWEIYGDTTPWDLDGVEHKVRMTNHPASDIRPRLRPGSQQVLFASDRTGNYDLFLIDWGGENMQQLTFHEGYDSQAAWSPDGRQIVFVSERDGNQEIYLMQPDGSQVTRLTFDGSDDFDPYWSPDGMQIVWVRVVSQDHGVLFVMNADGSNPHPISPPLRFIQHLSWSGDSAKIAFDFDSNGDGWSDIATINPDGSGLNTLATGGYLNGWYFDYWAGPWPGTDVDLLSSILRYIYYEGVFYVDKFCVGSVSLYSGSASCLPYSGVYELYPDSAIIDLTNPETQVEPLPKFVRATGFPLVVTSYDPGPAYLYNTYTQYRNSSDGEWMSISSSDWERLYSSDTTKRSRLIFGGDPGTTLYFRTQGEDWAENLEPWPPGDGDTSTTLYSWKLDGQVTDNRSRQIANHPITWDPESLNVVKTDSRGMYRAYLNEGNPQIALPDNHIGYQPSLESELSVSSDQSFNLYLQPQDNLFSNGNFESVVDPFQDWRISGTLTPTVGWGHSGKYAALLGIDCELPCLSEGDGTPFLGNYRSYPQVFVDDEQGVHLVWIGEEGWYDYRLFYSYRDPNGNWESPYLLGFTYPTDNGYFIPPMLKVDSLGNVHLIWLADDGINYAKKQGTSWSTPIILGLGYEYAMDVDQAGGIHILLNTETNTIYKEMDSAGVWQPDVNIYNSPQKMLDIAVDEDGIIHFLLVRGSSSENDILYIQYDPNKEYQDIRTIGDDQYNVQSAEMAVGGDGTVYAFWVTRDYSGNYVYKNELLDWSDVQTLDELMTSARVEADDQGTLHIAAFEGYTGYYYQLVPKKYGGIRYDFPQDSSEDLGFCMGPDNSLHFVWGASSKPIQYKHSKYSEENGNVILEQAASVPSDSHGPTLAWIYKFAATYDDVKTSEFQVDIVDTLQSTTVFTATTPSDWSLAWIDMQPWAGETITITLSLDQAADEPYVQLLLDEISLGSWLTPIITNVIPNKSMDWNQNPTTIAISGVNFIETPTVRISEVPVLDVQWIDENTITAIVPSDIPPGKYDVWVTNPEGQEAVLVEGLQLGELIYLPNVTR